MNRRLRFGSWAVAATLAVPLLVASPTAWAVKEKEKGKGKGKAAKAGAMVEPKLDVKSWTLGNGLQVLFVEDHKAPVATVQVYYHVGSKDETVGIRGVAHMFEHMMFKGTEHVPPEEHARLLKEVGGVSNAFTTEDITGYHETVPPAYVGFAMQLEAERMQHLRLTPATVASEGQVVREEKRLRVDNNPVGKALERFRAIAFQKHPYAWTAIGAHEDIQAATVATCQKFYDTFYAPNNATLVVVGDVTEAEVKKLAEQNFGSVPRKAEPARSQVQEPAQVAKREETMELEVQIPVIIGGYKIPRATDADVPALEVLSAILSGGESSRLNQRLVRKEKLALAAGGFAEGMEHPGLFIVFAAHLPDKNQAKVRQVLFEEIDSVRNAGVNAEELEKAKNQLGAGYIMGLQTVDGVAERLGHAQYVEGDWKRFLEGAKRYFAVTADDVKRVAGKYLVDTNLTLVSVKPGRGQGGVSGGAP